MSKTATKSRPIIFSGPMVRALLDGRKNQTRRVVKPQPERVEWAPGGEPWNPATGNTLMPCPYGQPGDELFVRETFRFPASLDKYSPAAIGEQALDANYRKPWSPTKYEADGVVRLASALDVFGDGTWGKTRVSIHMPRWASRITLTITNVRVERLNGISDDDACEEGLDFEGEHGNWFNQGEHLHIAGAPLSGEQYAFMRLWESINGAGSWQANPWVWVVEFQRKAGT